MAGVSYHEPVAPPPRPPEDLLLPPLLQDEPLLLP